MTTLLSTDYALVMCSFHLMIICVIYMSVYICDYLKVLCCNLLRDGMRERGCHSLIGEVVGVCLCGGMSVRVTGGRSDSN